MVSANRLARHDGQQCCHCVRQAVPTLQKTKSVKFFAKLIYRSHKGMPLPVLLTEAKRHRDRLERPFKDAALKNALKALIDEPAKAKTGWTPTASLVLDTLTVWQPGEKLDRMQAMERAQREGLKPQYRGDPVWRTILWLQRGQ